MKKAMLITALVSYVFLGQSVLMAQSDTMINTSGANTSENAALSSEEYMDDFDPTVYEEPAPLSEDERVPMIIMFTIMGIIYLIFPAIFYCIGSFSLARIDKHYRKVATSGISWVPFARYFNIVKNATKSEKKAYIVTVIPHSVFVIGVIGVIGMLVYGYNYSTGPSPLTFIPGIIAFLGLLGIIAMNFWRAFIIKNYVHGDTTTALGLSTYTSIVLWYIALDRSNGKTDIMGIVGFIILGLYLLFFIGAMLMAAVGGFVGAAQSGAF